jgi:hypothetical protein
MTCRAVASPISSARRRLPLRGSSRRVILGEGGTEQWLLLDVAALGHSAVSPHRRHGFAESWRPSSLNRVSATTWESPVSRFADKCNHLGVTR